MTERGLNRDMPGGMVIAPSILAADYARLGAEVAEAEAAGAEWFQLDVMDGHFVPNLTIGLPVLDSLRAVSDSFLDVHLMIDNPGEFLEPFAAAGADMLTVHQEVSATCTATCTGSASWAATPGSRSTRPRPRRRCRKSWATWTSSS